MNDQTKKYSGLGQGEILSCADILKDNYVDWVWDSVGGDLLDDVDYHLYRKQMVEAYQSGDEAEMGRLLKGAIDKGIIIGATNRSAHLAGVSEMLDEIKRIPLGEPA